MTIEHLVISGGGNVGFSFFGVIRQLSESNYLDIPNIKSIYATSIGAIIGTLICIKTEWEIIERYIADRPWHNAFKLTDYQILNVFNNKGIIGHQAIETVFGPLLKATHLTLDITLKELFDHSQIELHMFAFEVNKFTTIDISHKTHPDLSLILALSMTVAIPGLFIPVCINDKCYIDGGIMAVYPVQQCIDGQQLRTNNTTSILGINCNSTINYDLNMSHNITSESNIVELMIKLAVESINYISNKNSHSLELNHQICVPDEFSTEAMYTALICETTRKQMIKNGKLCAQDYLNLEQNITKI